MEYSGTTSRVNGDVQAVSTISVKYRQTRGPGRSSTSTPALVLYYCSIDHAHLAVVPRHVRICQYLREDGAQRRRAVRRGAIAGEPELLADEDQVRGGLLGRREREELADLEGGTAESARVLREDVVFE
jgi:hypothetical protein